MTAFINRLTTPEDRSIAFDPFGKWEAERSIHERDLKSYEAYKLEVSADLKLAAKFKKIHYFSKRNLCKLLKLKVFEINISPERT